MDINWSLGNCWVGVYDKDGTAKHVLVDKDKFWESTRYKWTIVNVKVSNETLGEMTDYLLARKSKWYSAPVVHKNGNTYDMRKSNLRKLLWFERLCKFITGK